ncbi:MAG: hypothetical protein PHI37_03320 [Candidatus Gracilibacteria bacterium]|nr:hypothetical protein [Candidatus Gracilibacteria bacterium]
MKKILIVCALSAELNNIKEIVKNLGLRDIKLSFFTTGMGNYNTILNLTRFLENNSFDFIINIGVCGYKTEKIDAFQVARIYNLANNKELIVPNLIDFLSLQSIACSDKIIFDSLLIGDENFVDMESYAFELVCDSFKIPRIILKIPVDKIGDETKNFDFEKAKKYLNENIDYKLLFEKISIYLENSEDKIDFEMYFKDFNFTFSEKEIFKKLYFRYKSLVGNDFDEYFLENSSLEKKVFLKNLEVFLEKFLIK